MLNFFLQEFFYNIAKNFFTRFKTYMINNFNNNFTFTGKSPLTKNIKLVKKAYMAEFRDVKKPASFHQLSPKEQLEKAEEIKEANMLLKVIREFNKMSFAEGGNFEVFRRLIGMMKTFKVGNCAEIAETGKTICHMNGIKNSDIFTLHAKSKDGKTRPLDHTIIAFKVPKSKNNITTKNNETLFEPTPDTRILDLYLDGKMIKVKDAKKVYSLFGLKVSEKLLFRPERTYEPTVETIELLKKAYPKFVIKK